MFEFGKCPQCGEGIKKGNKFCGSRCAAIYNNKHSEKMRAFQSSKKRPSRNCLNCGKEIPHCNKYCSNQCQHDYQYKENVDKWLNGEISGSVSANEEFRSFVKRYLLKKYDFKCQMCGWGEVNKFTNLVPLAVHHKDGSWKNNRPENLDILCPNCHSLTKTYGIGNKGNGRPWRTQKEIETNGSID